MILGVYPVLYGYLAEGPPYSLLQELDCVACSFPKLYFFFTFSRYI
jgi:hypothetical protein